MNPIRSILLWASQNETLRGRLPRLRSVRSSVARFMPGETADAAVGAARRLAGDGIPVTFTYLGENVAELADADVAEREYLALLDRIQAEGLDGEISVKLTQLGYDVDPEVTFGKLLRLAERSAEQGRALWIDMESSAYVDGTLDLYRRLLERVPGSGICLQAYLYRTPADIDDVLARGASIRLVKGAYREGSLLAEQRRRSVSERYLLTALDILRRLDGAQRLAIATHDVDLIDRIDRAASDDAADGRGFEVQMLYGIRVADQHRLARAGFRVRTLIAYGPHWYPWFMRRMAERPVGNMWLALRNAFTRRPS